MFKKILLAILLFIMFFVGFLFAAPSVLDTVNKVSWKQWVNLYKIKWLNSTQSLSNNIKALFYPSTYGWWEIWKFIRTLWVWVLILFLIRAWFLILIKADNEWERKKAQMNFLYILYGAVLFFWATWILGTMQFEWWTRTLIDSAQRNVFLQILTFLKASAFFVAMLMIIYYWYRIMQAMDKEDRIKESRKGIINVIIALVFIKIIDFFFFIAQKEQFASDAWKTIITINKMIWYILWWFIVLAVIYAWVLLVTSSWEEDKWTKAKATITTVFLVVIIIAIFLLIIQQVLQEVPVTTNS